jgi:hypothetical protein
MAPSGERLAVPYGTGLQWCTDARTAVRRSEDSFRAAVRRDSQRAERICSCLFRAEKVHPLEGFPESVRELVVVGDHHLRQAEWHGGDCRTARHHAVTLDLYLLASEGRPMP